MERPTILRTFTTSYGARGLMAHLNSAKPLGIVHAPPLVHECITYVPFVAQYRNAATARTTGERQGYSIEYRALRNA
jgi:hypothetical protein